MEREELVRLSHEALLVAMDAVNLAISPMSLNKAELATMAVPIAQAILERVLQSENPKKALSAKK